MIWQVKIIVLWKPVSILHSGMYVTESSLFVGHVGYVGHVAHVAHEG